MKYFRHSQLKLYITE